VEGQETADLAGGFSHTQVPFDFIEEVDIKEAPGFSRARRWLWAWWVHALVMKKATNNYHGSSSRNSKTMPWIRAIRLISRLDPIPLKTTTAGGPSDPTYQAYVAKKDKSSRRVSRATFGGPIWKVHILRFVAFFIA